jgi:hypothetical protein
MSFPYQANKSEGEGCDRYIAVQLFALARAGTHETKIHSGHEGFEVSFPSDHFAFSSVGLKGEPVQIQRFLNFSGVSFFHYPLTNGRHCARIWYHWYHPPLVRRDLRRSRRGERV